MKKIISMIAALAILSFSAYGEGFVHPGIFSTNEDIFRIQKAVENKAQPTYSGWEKLVASYLSNSNQSPRAVGTISRGGNGDNVALLYTDAAKAYQNALRWKIGKDEACGKTAANILNAWSGTLKTLTGNADRYLASGLYGYQLAAASEFMRDHPDFNTEQMQNMLMDVFYRPLCERFLYGNSYGGEHNGASITNYWANWDLSNMAAAMAIGIFCDREDIFNRAVDYFKYGDGNGSILHAVPYTYAEGLGQWQESGRDQAHTMLGIGLMASCCEMAWKQGIDLYGWLDSRFMYGAEYVAKYNNGYDVPFSTYQWRNGTNATLQTNTVVSNASRGQMRAIWEMIYNHYHNRMGLDVPNIKEAVEKLRPEGGPGGHASTFDQPGFGTLLYTSETERTIAPEFTNAIENGSYALKNCRSGKFIAWDGSSAVQGSETYWEIHHEGSGVYTIHNNSGYLTVEDFSYDNSAAVVLTAYNGGLNQKFSLVPRDDGIQIFPLHSGKPLAVRGSSNSNGAVINQHMNNYDLNQHWTLVPKNAEKSFITSAEAVYCTQSGNAEAKLALLCDGILESRPHLFDGEGSIIMDFGKDKGGSLSEIKTYGSGSISLSSDGVKWTTVAENSQNAWQSYSVSAEPSRYLKITGSGISELRLYGRVVSALSRESELIFFKEGYSPKSLEKTVDKIGIIKFEITPSSSVLDAVAGFTEAGFEPNGWSDFPVALRMNLDGYFDVRNGGNYESDLKVYYEPNKTYNARIEIDRENSVYNVFIDSHCIAYGYSFRTDAPKVQNIGEFSAISSCGSGTAYIREISVSDGKLSANQNQYPSLAAFNFMGLPSIFYGEGTVELDVEPTALTDGFIGFGGKELVPSAWGSYPVIIRLCTNGLFDAINGKDYIYSSVKYEPYKKYHISIDINTFAKTYSAYVTDEEGNKGTIAEDYAFRSSAEETDNIGIFSPLAGLGYEAGQFTVSSVKARSTYPARIYYDGENAVITSREELVGVFAAAVYKNGVLTKLQTEEVFCSGIERLPITLAPGEKIVLMLWDDVESMCPLAEKLEIKCC